MSRKIRIGSRKSRLAVIQTELVMDTIRETHPEIELELITMETTGDRRLDVTLDKIGGKGLFVKELDRALLEGRIDLAVHSLKDMPMEESSQIPILGYTKREDVRDVLVLPESGKPWEGRGVIGCSSFRRRIQGERLFPQAEFRSIRGNVLTRLEKLDRGEYDALILAAAGLKRLGLLDSPKYSFRFLDGGVFIPAGGQGILAIEGRPGSRAAKLCEAISHEESWRCLLAEREVLRLLEAGCHEPIGVYCQAAGKELLIQGISRRGGRVLRACLKGKMGEEMELAARLAAKLYG